VGGGADVSARKSKVTITAPQTKVQKGAWVNPKWAARVAPMTVWPKGVTETISQSTQKAFTSCQHRYWLRVEEQLTDPSGRAAELGSLAHGMEAVGLVAAFEMFEAIGTNDGYAVTESLTRMADRLREHAFDLIATFDDEDGRRKATYLGIKIEDFGEQVATAQALVERNLRKYLPTDLLTYELVATELPVVRLIPGLRGVAHTATIDALYAERSTGAVMVVDHKTTVDQPSDWIPKAQWDPQRPSYVWHVQGAMPGVHVDMVYNIIRKKLPGTPKLLACKKCDSTGAIAGASCGVCNGSGGTGFSAAACDTTGDAYRALAAKWPNLDISRVQHLVDALDSRGDTYNLRTAVYTSAGQVEEWLSEVRDVIRARREARTKKRWLKSRNECSSMFGLCPFREVCAEDRPETRAMFRRAPKPEDAPTLSDADLSALGLQSSEFDAPF
jgi:hypothetical protein